MLHCHTEGQPVFFTQVLLQDILQYNSASERPVEFTTTSQPCQLYSRSWLQLMNRHWEHVWWWDLHLSSLLYAQITPRTHTRTTPTHTHSHYDTSFNDSFLSYTRCRDKKLHTGIWCTCWRWTICFVFAINLILTFDLCNVDFLRLRAISLQTDGQTAAVNVSWVSEWVSSFLTAHQHN